MEGDESGRRRTYAVIATAGTGLVAALVALPWHHYAISVKGAGSFSLDRRGVESPDAALGRAAAVVAALLAATALVMAAGPPLLRDVLRRADHLVWPSGPALAALIALKTLKNTDYLGIGAWLAVVLAVVVAASAMRLRPARPEPG